LFSLGSRFRISPEEYDAFFRVYSGEIIGDTDFQNLVARHEDELLRGAGVTPSAEAIVQSLDVLEQEEEEESLDFRDSDYVQNSTVPTIAVTYSQSAVTTQLPTSARNKDQIRIELDELEGLASKSSVQPKAGEVRDRVSKELFIDFMSKDQKDPEIAL
jgi:hypothetical protein